MRQLILAGWGWKDYSCAAALLLRKFPKADVVGMSLRRLPEFLGTVEGYQEIIIAGVGLTGDVEKLMSALKRLKREKVSVTWLSSLPLSPELPDELHELLTIYVGGKGITDAVSRYYKIPYDDLASVLEEKPTQPEAKRCHELLDAAMYAYRNYQDEQAYGMAIRHLANRDPKSCWSGREKQLVDHFKRYGDRELAGRSEAIQSVIRKINLVAPHANARVMILGESGTGKETVALQIHNKSPRSKNGEFFAFNCASVTPNLLESRFFGYEKGAFTGAQERTEGLFQKANGGTLFLDEIGELPLEAQGLLLRVLEGGRFTRVGGTEELHPDVRLLTATNRDLPTMVRTGKFRKDLFFRLSVVQIRLPSLREHKEDIAQIADGYWIRQMGEHLSKAQLKALLDYNYPGNVRELLHLLEQAIVLQEKDFTRLIDEQKQLMSNLTASDADELPDNLDEATCQHVRNVVEKYGGNKSKAADALGISRNTVRTYLEKQ